MHATCLTGWSVRLSAICYSSFLRFMFSASWTTQILIALTPRPNSTSLSVGAVASCQSKRRDANSGPRRRPSWFVTTCGPILPKRSGSAGASCVTSIQRRVPVLWNAKPAECWNSIALK